MPLQLDIPILIQNGGFHMSFEKRICLSFDQSLMRELQLSQKHFYQFFHWSWLMVHMVLELVIPRLSLIIIPLISVNGSNPEFAINLFPNLFHGIEDLRVPLLLFNE